MPSYAAQCAHDLFAQLRSMDALGVQEIWIEKPPDGEAWEGVKDRLQRAAA
jgi:L-threonylcarbamoyladenylate synthase